MKGKVAVYFAAPNLGRLRSRIENAPKTLTSDLRTKLQEIAVKALNNASLQIRAEFIDYIAGREDLKFKTADHKKQAMNLCSGIFDTVFAIDNDSLNKLVGDDEEETAGEEAPAEETAEETAGEEKPAEEAAEGDKAPKKGKGKKEADAGDEFAD